MISDKTSWGKRKPFLESNLSTALVQDKQGVLTQHHYVWGLQIAIEMNSQLSSLFSDISDPTWLHL
jgi:hypothetical protein